MKVVERFDLVDRKLQVGKRLQGVVYTVSPNLPWELDEPILDKRGGGFFGEVAILPDKVVKTTQPDPMHDFFRRLVWRGPFPSQVMESATQLDTTAAIIYSKLWPLVTNGAYCSPNGFGYMDLPTGFAQVLKRMHGGGFDLRNRRNNYAEFQQARVNAWAMGKAFGLEAAAQVHPDNPFGGPNLWKGTDGRWIILDVHPAIPHTGQVLIWNFPFHDDVRNELGEGEVTFNTIHTQKVRKGLDALGISGTPRDELEYYLHAYDKTRETYDQEVNQPVKDLIIAEGLKRGFIDRQIADKLRVSNVAFNAYVLQRYLAPAFATIGDIAKKNPLFRLGFDQKFQQDMIRFMFDPAFRYQTSVEQTMLSGMRQAHEMGIVSDDEWREAWEQMNKEQVGKLAVSYMGLEVHYLATSQLVNLVEGAFYASALFSTDPTTRAVQGFLIGRILPILLKTVPTLALGMVTKQDLRRLAIFSSVPLVGSYIGELADMVFRFGKYPDIVHFNQRALVATISKLLRPWGGWNSDLEARFMEELANRGVIRS